MNIRLIIFPLAIALCSSCNDQQAISKASINTYYNIDSLLDTQLEQLNKAKAKLYKQYRSNDYQEEATLNMDSIQWVQALSTFRVLDINKPSLKDAYEIIDHVSDSISNLTILQYKLKEVGASQKLKELNFYYLGSIQSLKKITAKSGTNGYIYCSARSYELIFDESLEKTWLEKYIIKTDQKTLFQDSLKTTVEFEIKH